MTRTEPGDVAVPLRPLTSLKVARVGDSPRRFLACHSPIDDLDLGDAMLDEILFALLQRRLGRSPPAFRAHDALIVLEADEQMIAVESRFFVGSRLHAQLAARAVDHVAKAGVEFLCWPKVAILIGVGRLEAELRRSRT